MTGLEISVVITTVIISFIISSPDCPVNSVSIVAQGGLDVIVVDSVVRRVLVVTADDPESGILGVLVMRLRHNRTGVGEELSLVVVILLLRSCLLQLRCCPPPAY